MSKPEELARQKIDELLSAAGWIVQPYKQMNLGAGQGIALTEVPLKTGPCDYLLLVDRVPVGVIEAKKAGTTPSIYMERTVGPTQLFFTKPTRYPHRFTLPWAHKVHRMEECNSFHIRQALHFSGKSDSKTYSRIGERRKFAFAYLEPHT